MIVTCHLVFYSVRWAYGYLSSRFIADAEPSTGPPSQPPPPQPPAPFIINPQDPGSSVDPPNIAPRRRLRLRIGSH
uniref:Uncharacterized protein n=1 Tax=Magallana gigas TaxID=29159 RepID=K1Q6J7_MAGGI